MKVQNVIIRTLFHTYVPMLCIDHTTSSSSATTSSSLSDTYSSLTKCIILITGPMYTGKTTIMKHLREDIHYKLPSLSSHDQRRMNSELMIVDMGEISDSLVTESRGKPDDNEDAVTQSEAEYIAELLIEIALDHGVNIMINGILQNIRWQERYFHYLQEEYFPIHYYLLHITASQEIIQQRYEERYQITKHAIPQYMVANSLQFQDVHVYDQFQSISKLIISIDTSHCMMGLYQEKDIRFITPWYMHW